MTFTRISNGCSGKFVNRAETKATVPNNAPGKRWVRSFYQRYRSVLKEAVSDAQKQKRFLSINAKTLALHFPQLEELVDKYKLYEKRIWNLDVTGISPGRDLKEKNSGARFLRRYSKNDFQLPNFTYNNRLTMLPVVSAAGETGPLLFIFKGVWLPHRKVLVDGVTRTETVSSNLPRVALVYMREESAKIDSNSFYQFSRLFTAYVRELTENGRHVLLPFDACRSNMSLRAFEHFRENNIIIYALPAHSSKKTQPLDTGVFGTFKREVNEPLWKWLDILSQM